MNDTRQDLKRSDPVLSSVDQDVFEVAVLELRKIVESSYLSERVLSHTEIERIKQLLDFFTGVVYRRH